MMVRLNGDWMMSIVKEDWGILCSLEWRLVEGSYVVSGL